MGPERKFITMTRRVLLFPCGLSHEPKYTPVPCLCGAHVPTLRWPNHVTAHTESRRALCERDQGKSGLEMAHGWGDGGRNASPGKRIRKIGAGDLA